MTSPDPLVRLAAMEAELAALLDTATATLARLCSAQVELAALCAAREDAAQAAVAPVAGPPRSSIAAPAGSSPSPEAEPGC